MTRRIWRQAGTKAAGACAVAVLVMPAMAASSFAEVPAAPSGYLNLHQCTYSGGLSLVVNNIPNSSPAFGAGSNVSNVKDTQLKCNPGISSASLVLANSGVTSLDLTASR